MDTIAAASQDRCISGFKCERKGIHCHVRPGFIDDTDHTHGNPHLSDCQSVGALLHGKDLPDGIVQGGNLSHTLCDPGDPLLRKEQTVL